GRDVDAVDLVVGDVALLPLDRRAHGLEHLARLLRDRLQLAVRQLPRAGKLALDHEFRHRHFSCLSRALCPRADRLGGGAARVLRRRPQEPRAAIGTIVPRAHTDRGWPNPASRAMTIAW